jgi:opacity protein-like surface antigen
MKRALLGLALAAILPMSAQAADGATSAVSYNTAEVSYLQANWFDEDFNGYSLAGSVGFANHWYATANYRSADDQGFTVDETKINLGFHTAVSDKADFIAEAGYARIGFDIDGFGDDSSSGWNAAVGFRGMFTPQFEGSIKGTYTDINDLDQNEFGIQVGAVWHFTDNMGLTGSYEHTSLFDEDMDIWSIGFRGSW